MSRFLLIWSNPLSWNATATQFPLLSSTMKVACDFSVFKAVNEKIEITFRSGGFIIRKLCKGGFKHSTSIGTVAFSFFICLNASNVVLFSVFTLIETICPKIEARVQNIYFRWTCFAQKRFFLSSPANLSKQQHIWFPSILNIFSTIFPSLFKSAEYSDYLQDLHKQDRLYEYNNTNDAMKKILSDFYKNCRLRIEHLKAKHRRELRLLARLKQEATEKGEIVPTSGSLRKISRGVFGFTPRYNTIVQVNGFSHWPFKP